MKTKNKALIIGLLFCLITTILAGIEFNISLTLAFVGSCFVLAMIYTFPFD